MEEDPKPSRRARWITLVALALPLLYLASVPWVDIWRVTHGLSDHSFLGDPNVSLLLRIYWGPFEWLLEMWPAGWLERYYFWCNDLAGNPLHIYPL